MIRQDYVYQKFGSLKRDVISSTEMTAEQVLQELVFHLRDMNTDVSAEETDDGWNIVVSISLTEDLIFRITE